MLVRFVPLLPGPKLENSVGMHFTAAGWVNPKDRIRARLDEKRANNLNVTDMPYVVVLVSTDPHCTDQDVRRAIYGSGMPSYSGPERDGFLDGNQNTRLSAVLWIPEWSITTKYLRRRSALFENAHASFPLAPELLPWQRRIRPDESHVSGDRGLLWYDRRGGLRHPDDIWDEVGAAVIYPWGRT